MAASAKRKQEEKHLKLLREMSSLPPNRKCFDCDQRGPTYTDMTVGSFVCTSCSGILRGLNPPHRVKSISMTTFTQQEIEFLQKHGNEVCKQIWLGLFDDRSSAIPDFRDPQKVKEFLQEKYEKKRWYVPPEQAKVVASVHASISGSSASSTSSTPEVKPLKSLLGESAPALHLNKGTPSQSPVIVRSQGQQQQEKKQFDLLSDLGSDIFAAPAPQSTATANFANFAHFNSHTGGSEQGSGFGTVVTAPSGPAVSAPSQPSASSDKYAALAELDSVFSSTATSSNAYTSTSNVSSSAFGTVPVAATAQTQPASSSVPAPFGATPSTNPFVAAPVAPVAPSTNPFQTNSRGATAATFGTASMSMPAGFGTPASYSLPTSFSGNFQQPAFPTQGAFPQQTAFAQQPNGAGFAAFGQAKPVVTPFGQVAAVGVSSNPFMNTFTADLTKRKEDTNVRLLKIATALDPRFKNLKWLPKSKSDEVWRMFSDVLKEQYSDAETTDPERPKKKINLLRVTSDSEDENEHASVSSALDSYQSEPIISMDACPLEWWLKHEGTYDSLAHLARKCLAMLATTVPCECLFSFSGDIVNKTRAALSPANCNQTCLS
ncbi:arf-GAP domain and FG repeat-containing protein 1 isoform X7 [Chelonia mydas]|uniref:arf-GAP domain and FG repeat-containing protein 1 isoform X7 n=1 Tax=Chelonia mydas TaxID=8469 RepID=UPI001CA935DD|nr:arf-GAP domain and FG repeat-containing protein 1 isoform X7 [Chelonia mydas]